MISARRIHPSLAASRSAVGGDVCGRLREGLQEAGVTGVEVEPPPPGLEAQYATLLTPQTVTFITHLTQHFNDKVDQILLERRRRKLELDSTGSLPKFAENSKVRETDWKVDPVPCRVQCRRLELGDVSPANTDKFLQALRCDVNSIQVDFDDGHCPTWRNQLLGHHNVYGAVHGLLPHTGDITQVPILMFRPRAWNMIEHNLLVNGKKVPGPLFDFGLFMFHCAHRLVQTQSGPFVYLSKVEGANEARLWNEIFCWVQNKLDIPQGTIKATVLIENILATFEMEEILYELRHHSLGLNCGMWDYVASIINKFGCRRDFLLGDRSKTVNMEHVYLRSYRDLLIQTCHKRGAHATGGMVATILQSRDLSVITKITTGKFQELVAGIDGFLVYDVKLIPVLKKIMPGAQNQLSVLREDVRVRPADLLQLPAGGVTLECLQHNIAVGVLFIDSWLRGQGHYIYKAAVEDSATAEISRSQIWQWIRHQAIIEDTGEVVSRGVVQRLITEFVDSVITSGNVVPVGSKKDKQRLQAAAEIFEEIVTKRDFPEFITTYLNVDHTFLTYQKQLPSKL